VFPSCKVTTRLEWDCTFVMRFAAWGSEEAGPVSYPINKLCGNSLLFPHILLFRISNISHWGPVQCCYALCLVYCRLDPYTHLALWYMRYLCSPYITSNTIPSSNQLISINSTNYYTTYKICLQSLLNIYFLIFQFC